MPSLLSQQMVSHQYNMCISKICFMTSRALLVGYKGYLSSVWFDPVEPRTLLEGSMTNILLDVQLTQAERERKEKTDLCLYSL